MRGNFTADKIMKITDIIKSKEAVLSFEVFPPKTDDKF